MSKHTPAPWRVDGRNVMAMKVKQICEVPCFGVIHGKVDAANARLIAAAPELLGALKMLLATAGEINDTPNGLLEMALDSDDLETRNQANAHLCARAAIDKAEGRP